MEKNLFLFMHYILGSVDDLKRALRMYEYDKQHLLIEKLVKVQKENYCLLEMPKKLQSEMSSSTQLNAILEVEIQTACVKHGELQTTYFELQNKNSQVLHKNEILLTKISKIKEDKWIVE